MSTSKEIEFEVGTRTYRIITRLDNSYDIHGFNSLMSKVTIHDDLLTGEKIFVNWSNVAVIRFKDAPSS